MYVRSARTAKYLIKLHRSFIFFGGTKFCGKKIQGISREKLFHQRCHLCVWMTHASGKESKSKTVSFVLGICAADADRC
jgi:hypothetical protein